MKNSIKRPLFRIFDLFVAPFSFIFLPFLKLIRKYGVEEFPLNLKAFLTIGVFPIRDHYYEPRINYPKDFDAQKKRPLKIDFDIPGQLAHLQMLNYKEELTAFKKEGIPTLDHFYIDNPSFGPGDLDMYYLMIRNSKPKRIIEIGSGFTTLLAVEAIKKNREEGYHTELICIEPYEMAWLEKIQGITLIRENVEKVEIELFKTLQENDILFIDSSHIIRPDNDVLFEYLELLPEINKGVIIHIHDIFSPRHYQQKWLTSFYRFWNEQYLLEAFLYYNDAFKIMFSLNYLKNDHYEATKKILLNLTPESEPASFWLKKVK